MAVSHKAQFLARTFLSFILNETAPTQKSKRSKENIKTLVDYCKCLYNILTVNKHYFMLNSELLIHNKADDKNYLLGKNIQVIDGKYNNKLIELHFRSEDNTINYQEINTFQKSQNIPNISIPDIKKIEEYNWLLSMGTIILFGENLETAEIPLIERDEHAKSDPLHLTMPAGRLDMKLSSGCMAELFEEMIFANNENYFQVDKGVCAFGQIQKQRIETLGFPNKNIQVLPSANIQIPNIFTVRMFLDDREIDNVDNVFVSVDSQNSTLEFRQVLLTKKPENLEYIIDGDGYKRNMFLFPLQELQQESVNGDAFLSKNNFQKSDKKYTYKKPVFTKTLHDFLLNI